MKIIKVPTGMIFIEKGDKNIDLEFLAVRDYGKNANIKADFLGYHNKIYGVNHNSLLPWEEKTVITISSQYGCAMNCNFCDVPKVGAGLNVTFNDLNQQVFKAIKAIDFSYTRRLNLHYARMGEPTWNPNIIKNAYYLAGYFAPMRIPFHPVVSTMMPKTNANLKHFLIEWMEFKNNVNEAGLQLSINSTSEKEKALSMPRSMPIDDISSMMESILKRNSPKGRKITLNFAITGNSFIDANYLANRFNPNHFIVKLTPIHETSSSKQNGYNISDSYSNYDIYEQFEEPLKYAGFDVLTFIPSLEEDHSRITCGNAILSDFAEKLKK